MRPGNNSDNRQFIEKYFADTIITGELCGSSILKYRDSIKKFLSVICNPYLGDLTNKDFDFFVLRMKEHGASGARIRNVISAMKSLISHLQKEGLVTPHLDMDKIRKPRLERKDVAFLTLEEIKIFLQTIADDIAQGIMIRKIRMMALVILMLQTGARIGEALSIKISDIDRINLEIPIIGKGRKSRYLFLTRDTLYWIDRYLEIRKSSCDYLFTTLSGNTKWSQTDVGRSFRYYKNKSGISKHFVLHTLRHTTATQLTLKGAPMNSIQHILGHTRLETTIRYYIGAVEKNRAKEIMNDDYYRFIPEAALPSPQNSKTGGALSLPAPCPHPDNTCKSYPTAHDPKFPSHGQSGNR